MQSQIGRLGSSMTGKRDFSDLNFDAFREMAKDPSLSRFERIGFPDSYREGQEAKIFADILGKLSALEAEDEKVVVDVGPGCSDLPKMLIELCKRHRHDLHLVDSQEMLDHLSDSGVTKIPARFPDCPDFLQRMHGRVDVVLTYSVLHYAFSDASVFSFLDAALFLLAPGGALLIGDIPNVSKRRRFFSSDAGVRFHQKFMNTQERPPVNFNRLERGQIDDAVILSLVSRARASGFDAYVLPQHSALPMANRREDILILRP
jgi:hypothetical protein